MNSSIRKSVAVLVVSIACLAGIELREGFEPVARPPLPGDVPTVGFGSTQYADGSPVRNGDTITKPEARKLMTQQVKDEYESGIRKCAPDLLLLEREWDFLVDSAYNLGVSRVCNSGMVREFRSGNYDAGCAYILKYTYFQGKDCRIRSNKCGGIPIDRQRAYKMCMGVT